MNESAWKRARKDVSSVEYIVDRQLRAHLKTPLHVHIFGIFSPNYKMRWLKDQERRHRKAVKLELKQRAHYWKAWKEAKA